MFFAYSMHLLCHVQTQAMNSLNINLAIYPPFKSLLTIINYNYFLNKHYLAICKD